mmetsp:Transcript_67805/g.136447  ORF Transcript_67805/g.136447 Transcript_67805/m.136447 type:complete len:165 (+) Transcript_67805:55-549(+)
MARSLLFRSVSAGASTPVAVRPISFFTTTFDEVFVEAVRLSNPNGMAIGWESGLSRAFSSRDFSDSTLSRRSRFDALFNTMDTNKDGVLTLEEVEAAAESKLGLSREKAALLFTELDLDGDGVLSRESGPHRGFLKEQKKQNSRKPFKTFSFSKEPKNDIRNPR